PLRAVVRAARVVVAGDVVVAGRRVADRHRAGAVAGERVGRPDAGDELVALALGVLLGRRAALTEQPLAAARGALAARPHDAAAGAASLGEPGRRRRRGLRRRSVRERGTAHGVRPPGRAGWPPVTAVGCWAGWPLRQWTKCAHESAALNPPHDVRQS